MNELKVFSSSEFGELGIMLIDGKEYFPGSQCAMILGYASPKDAIARHCKGAIKRRLPTNGGEQDVKYISEGDLYRLIVSSKLPSAQKFEHWVFDEVLPSMRKTGQYVPDIEQIIAKTATAVVSEVLKQIVPLISRQTYSDPLEDIRIASMTDYIPRKKAANSIIRRLDEETRSRVDEMLLSDRYSYGDIRAYLSDMGISISEAAVCRYRKSFYKK